MRTTALLRESWPARRKLAPVLGAAGAALLLAGITALYLHPNFVIDIANQLWSCF